MIIDVVPNHTSEDHPWFRAALAAPPDSPERRRYLFRDGLGPDGEQPPNDWQSGFGGSGVAAGSATASGTSTASPRNSPISTGTTRRSAQDFRTTLRFWADRGVDGFRVDVAHGLVKDMSEPYRPWAEISEMMVVRTARIRCGIVTTSIRSTPTGGGCSRSTTRRASRSPRPVCIRAAGPGTPRRRVSARPSTSRCRTRTGVPTDFRRVIDSGLADMRDSGSTTTWLLGCHDRPRVATRYGLPLERCAPGPAGGAGVAAHRRPGAAARRGTG